LPEEGMKYKETQETEVINILFTFWENSLEIKTHQIVQFPRYQIIA
jgi:hypothetical protein